MFIEQFYDEGLAHLSYIIGDENQAAVIDPRMDIDVYLEAARKHGATITHIFETHRNEDYVVGSCNLAKRTRAKIYHGANLDFSYGNSCKEGDRFEFGKIVLKILETPGHTPESISLVVVDTSTGETPLGVFTGDALFVGTAGRTDFWKTREEAAAILYDSIYHKLLPLGDQVVLYPAHGAGSVCGGADMANRNFSTIGYEKEHNQSLQCGSKQEFVDQQKIRTFENPPYFKEMERRNQHGPDVLYDLPEPSLVQVKAFEPLLDNHKIQVIDIRSPESYAGAAIPNSLSLPLPLLSGYVGWFLDYDKDIALIADSEQQQEAIKQLVRLGYNRITHALEGGLHKWEVSGNPFWTIPAIHAETVKKRIESNNPFILLDVRKDEEWEQGHLPNATHAFLGTLREEIDSLNISKDQTITTFCGSGQRAVVASSILKSKGYQNVEVCLGSMQACKAVGCPIEEQTEQAA